MQRSPFRGWLISPRVSAVPLCAAAGVRTSFLSETEPESTVCRDRSLFTHRPLAGAVSHLSAAVGAAAVNGFKSLLSIFLGAYMQEDEIAGHGVTPRLGFQRSCAALPNSCTFCIPTNRAPGFTFPPVPLFRFFDGGSDRFELTEGLPLTSETLTAPAWGLCGR